MTKRDYYEVLGVPRDATPDQMDRLKSAKQLVWEGVQLALDGGAPADKVGVLVDEEMGTTVAEEARARGVTLAMPVEASGPRLVTVMV